MYEQVRQVVLESGLWDDGRELSHGFILSPSVYVVPQAKRNELQEIGFALYDCLAGLGDLMADACHTRNNGNHLYGMITRILRTGIPAIYHDLMVLHPDRVPSICKVDIMESDDGNFFIAEIDGHNKHGLGYSILGARIRDAVVMPQNHRFPGVAAIIAQEVKHRGEDSIILLYADQERFYLPEFRILESELARLGVELTVVAESDTQIEHGHLVARGDKEKHKLFVDFPFLYHNQELDARMAELYKNNEIDFLIPPKPFLGSKAVLALLRNDLDDSTLEDILLSYICPKSLELLRRYIPETYLVRKRSRDPKVTEAYWVECCGGKKFVLKESISSGMKGTAFMDDANFNAIMARACSSYYRFILQQEVTNRARNFQYFGDKGELKSGDWFVRVTVHYVVGGIADIIVTARRDKKVHGALDCLQLGSIIV